MENVLYLTIQQVAHFAGVPVAEVRQRCKSRPGVEPLYALEGVEGFTVAVFDAKNVVVVYPRAAEVIGKALGIVKE